MIFFPLFITFPFCLWWGRWSSVPPWGYSLRWEKIHTKRTWSLLTVQPSRGWARGLWRSLALLPLWLFEPCSPSGLCKSAPAWETHEMTDKYPKTWATKMWSVTLKSLPVQSELWPPQSRPPVVSSWRRQRGTWVFCWSFRLRCRRPGFSPFLKGGQTKNKTWNCKHFIFMHILI